MSDNNNYEAPQNQPNNNGQPGFMPYGQPVVHNQKSKIAAGLLGILLGTFGIHNFYLGYIGRGVAQLLITLLSFGILSFVSWIWGIVEGILYLTAQPNSTWAYDAEGIPLI